MTPRYMHLLCVGVNFRTASLAVREQAAIAPSEIPAALRMARAACGSAEAAVLSTCNRVEYYAAAPDPDATASRLREVLVRHDPAQHLSASTYTLTGSDAIRHLFRVAAGLESMILGESEIIAQVKQAYLAACASGATGPMLDRLFQKALHGAKTVRSETRIAEGQASVGSVVVALAKQVFGERLRQSEALLWGAGKAAEATAQHLIKAGIRQLWIVNRTQAKAQDLASQCRGRLLSWEQALAHLAHVDIAIVCTQAPHYVIGQADMDALQPRRGARPLCLIDLAVPRNVDPALKGRAGIRVYDMDDLQGMAQRTLAARQEELARATALIEQQTGYFMRWWQTVSAQEDLACQLVAA